MRQIPRNYVYFFCIVILSLFIRAISLNQSFWLDEAAQAVLSAKPLGAVNYAVDFQPPLYYILIHFWMKLGIHGEWFLRLPSILFGAMTCGATYILFKNLFNRKVGLISGLLLALAPYHIYYSQELRMYSLLTFLVLLSWVFLYKNQWKRFAIISALAFFTHYFAFVNIFAQMIYVVLADRKNVQKISFYSGLAILPFMLWIPTLLKQIEQSKHLILLLPGWKAVSNPGFFKFIPLVFAKFTVGMIRPENKILYALSTFIMVAIFFSALTVVARKYQKIKMQSEKNHIRILLAAFFLPLFIAWIAGMWIDASSVWRIQFILPFFYGIIAFGLYEMRRIGKMLIGIVFLVQIVFSSLYLFNTRYQRENWRDAVAYTDAHGQNGARVLVEFSGPFAPIEWYSKDLTAYAGTGTDVNITPESVKIKLKDKLKNNPPVMLYTYLYELTDPQQHVDQYLKTKGYTITSEKDFRGVGIIKSYKP